MQDHKCALVLAPMLDLVDRFTLWLSKTKVEETRLNLLAQKVLAYGRESWRRTIVDSAALVYLDVISPGLHDMKLHNNPVGSGKTWRHVRDQISGLDLEAGTKVYSALVKGEPLFAPEGWEALQAADIHNQRRTTHDKAAAWLREHMRQTTEEQMLDARDCVTTMLQFLEPAV